MPFKAIEIGEFGALLTTCTIPEALPLVVGANTTLNVLFAPALIVIGKPLMPLRLKPVPLTAPELIVRGEEPEDVSVTVPVVNEPTAMLPKFIVVALTVSFGAAGVCCPEKTTSTQKFEDS